MIYEDERDPRYDLPIGMSMRSVQNVDRVYFNCALCHATRYHTSPQAKPVIVAGGGSHPADEKLALATSFPQTDFPHNAKSRDSVCVPGMWHYKIN